MTLSVKYDRKKVALLLVLSIVFTGVSYGLALTSDPFVFGVAQVAFIFFIVLTLLNMIRLMDEREVLRIDETGLFDRRLVDETIPWDVLTSMKEVRLIGLRFYAVAGTEPVSTYITSRPKRWMARVNGLLGFYPIGISATGLATDHARIGEALAAHLPLQSEEEADETE